MQRCGAAKRDHRAGADIPAAFDRMNARRVRHVLVDDLADASAAWTVERSSGTDVFDHRSARRAIEPHGTAGERRRVDTTEHEISIGHGRLRAAATVAAGPGSEPALSGPTAMRRSVSTRAIEPPPAPISTISITGIRKAARCP